jgi:hypothetical protein
MFLGSGRSRKEFAMAGPKVEKEIFSCLEGGD